MRKSFTWMKWAVLASSIWLTGCGTISTLGKLESGAGSEASRMWDRWVEGEGDIAVATTIIHQRFKANLGLSGAKN